ncbi:MAG: AAA family ATPase [Elusimicrobia bacterium]|nr:AAA family ATPase [Elusimicrobiota bacterium]
MAVMEKLAFFGKGGIGKSTISANLSAILASEGRKILHIGCDPKHDSTLALTEDASILTFQERHQASHFTSLTAAEVLTKGKFGIDCVEAGGPEPGLGCAGYGINQLLETLERLDLMSPAKYDTVIFDILGDVVCGGFAAPLRQGFADKIFIVASEEMAALYAANNIAKAVRTYTANGAVLGGLIVNMRDPEVDREMLERFARLLNTRILGFVPRDPIVREAEYLRKTLIEHDPGSGLVRVFKDLAAAVAAVAPGEIGAPTPMDDRLFTELSLRQFRSPPMRAQAGSGAAAPAKTERRPEREKAQARRVGGPRSLESFSKLLKLEDRWRLESAFLSPDGCIGLGVKGEDKSELVVVLKPTEIEGTFIKTPNFGLCFQGAGNPTPAAESLLRRTASRLGLVPLRTLQRVLERDPGAVGAVSAPAGAGNGRARPGDGGPPQAWPDGAGGTAAAPDQSVQFFLDETSAVGGFPQGALFVHHGDWECWFVFLSGPFGFWERKHNEGTLREGNDGPRVAQLSTDSGLEDVIRGGGVERLEAMVEDFLRRNPKPDLLVIRSYCVPAVIGDDVSKVLERMRRKYDFAIAAATALNPEIAILKTAIAQAFSSPRYLETASDPNKVDLIGFPSGRPRAELAGLVAELGLEVGQSILPGWTYTSLVKLRESGLQVLSPRSEYGVIFAELAKGPGLKFISPESPYGLLGTRNWLKAVAAAAGRPERFEEAFGERYRGLRRTWRALRASAARHRLAFVIPEADAAALSDGRSLGGLPLLPMVREMGFGVELLLWSPSPSSRPAVPGVKRFNTPEELDRLLSEGDFSAVYSDVCHDRRLLRNGKSRFSRAAFEPGFDGAVRTLRRLLRICRLPFHRRYETRWRHHGVQ